MELVYLSNGQACYLKEKIGERFIVNKIFEYEQFYGEHSEMVETVDYTDVVVDSIFHTPPIEKFSSEILELKKTKHDLQKDIILLQKEKSQLTKDVSDITKTKISSDKFIINKTDLINAKTLALFPKDSVMPKIMDSTDVNFRGLKVLMETTVSSNEERYWGYKLYYDQGFPYSEFLCQKYGILINPTEEEIEETIKKRLLEFEFEDYKLCSVDDKYLTEELLKRKNNYLSEKRLKEKDNLQKKLIDIQQQLNEFENNK